MSTDFCSLHTHTSYSTLDGASKISELVARAKELGMSSLGISDHGHLAGVPEFYKECKAQGIKPILGQEFYFCEDRTVRGGTGAKGGSVDGSDKRYNHLSIYAADQDGYQNLLKLSSDAYLNGIYYKPRSDYAMLEQHSKGIIVGSGCLGGPVLQPLLHGDYDQALNVAKRLQDCVGKENFYIELMNHGLPEQLKTNPQLIEIAKTIGAPIYATQDTHYTHKHDAASHDALLCCQTGSLIKDEKRFRFHNDEYYLKSGDEMLAIFSEVPEACTNTLLIAERCNVEIDFSSLHLPTFDIPEGFDSDNDYLMYLVSEKLLDRYPDPSQEVLDRVGYELSVFESMNVASYMLILWDIIEFMKSQGMFTPPGRGSAAGSIVSYILGVTKVDPIQYNLLFERFLNPSRIALPDVDLDIEQRYREHVINYTVEKYGEDYVSQIITFVKIKARTAVKDAARVLGYDFATGDRISKMMPPLVSGVDTTLTECFEESPKNPGGYAAAAELRADYAINPTTEEIVNTARGLEGLHKSFGIHAAAVVIGDRPIDELVPRWKNSDGVIAAQWDKKAVEALGLVKMDYLGLKNLDIISDAQRLIGRGFSVEDQPMDDPKTFYMLQQGHSVGCFQIESSGMQSLLRSLKPDNMEDLSAVIALYRPGPMAQDWHNEYARRKNKKSAAVPFHEDATEILAPTFALMIYQEQIMQVAQKFAGYTATEADNLRKIIGKKLPDEMKAEASKFVAGCVSQGYDEQFSSSLFDMIDGFSLYGFNKSHSISYAFITYWTAYLKAHYPREYMAALLSHSMDKVEHSIPYISEARRMGLKIYPPSVHSPSPVYTVEEDGIRMGMVGLRGVGNSAVSDILTSWNERPFDSLTDFVNRVNPNVATLRGLACAGTLDGWGTRQGIASVAQELLDDVRKRKSKQKQTESLFDITEYVAFDIPNVEFSNKEKMEYERHYLGVYLTGHPLDDYEPTATSIASLEGKPEGTKHKVLVVIESVATKTTRKGDTMATITVSDQTGATDLTVFPATWNKCSQSLVPGSVVEIVVIPKWDTFRDQRGYNLIAIDEVEEVEYNDAVTESRVGIYVPRGFRSNPPYMGQLKTIFLEHKGNKPVDIYAGRNTLVTLKDDFKVDVSDAFKQEIKELFEKFKQKK